MKLFCTALGLAAICAVGLGAQSSTTKSKTKVDVKDGKEISVQWLPGAEPQRRLYAHDH